jgi:predicted nucleotidyltransferase
MLLSVILYGSRARGDHRATSDTDLLGVIEDGRIRKEISSGGVSLYHYPAPLLKSRSSKGDLFVLHLISEGKVLHDTLGIFSSVKRSFEYKSSYADEIFDGSLIIKFLISRPNVLSQKSARKRLVWAIRTILIARNAEHKRASFSSSALMSFSGITGLKDAIDNRHQRDTDDIIKVAERTLRKFGDQSVEESWPSDKPAQRALLLNRGGVAGDTLRFIKLFNFKKLSNAPLDVDLENLFYSD